MSWQEHTDGEWLLIIDGRVFAGVSPVGDGWWRWVSHIPNDHPAALRAAFVKKRWWGIYADPTSAKSAAEGYLREMGVKEVDQCPTSSS